MSGEEKLSTAGGSTTAKTEFETTTAIANSADPIVEQERSEKILKAKELYSQGSRNFLVKSYAEAADELSQVCALYEELYGELSAELGMPYLLYAKSLIALAVDENKVIDVPDEADEDDEDDEEEIEDDEVTVGTDKGTSLSTTKTNGSTDDKVANVEKSSTEADSTADTEDNKTGSKGTEEKPKVGGTTIQDTKTTEEVQVSSSNDAAKKTNGSTSATTAVLADGEKPSTSNGDNDYADADVEGEDDENEAASNLQLAWEILELAGKIFSRQGLSGLPNLAEVQTELANIEFENNIMDAAREDYEKALKIYKDLPKNYHRAMAEIHYKIGLTYLMQQLNKEGAASLKEACDLIEAEITEIKSKDELTEKDKNNIQDMEETKQEIRAKIDEIEDTQAQNIAEVRAALDSYIKPIVSQNSEEAGTSSSSKKATDITSNTSPSSQPTNISHLIKRKKPEEPGSEAEASPAKRPAI